MPDPIIRHLDLRHMELVRLGPDTVAPRRFGATIEVGRLEVELVVELDNKHTPHCRSVTVRNTDVTANTLREIGLAKLVALALEAATWPYEETATGGRMPIFPGSRERERLYEQSAEGARRPRKGSPLTEEDLAKVAEIYRTAVAHGDPPDEAIAHAMHASRSTAARWVRKARDVGLLGDAVPGRSGEAS